MSERELPVVPLPHKTARQLLRKTPKMLRRVSNVSSVSPNPEPWVKVSSSVPPPQGKDFSRSVTPSLPLAARAGVVAAPAPASAPPTHTSVSVSIPQSHESQARKVLLQNSSRFRRSKFAEAKAASKSKPNDGSSSKAKGSTGGGGGGKSKSATTDQKQKPNVTLPIGGFLNGRFIFSGIVLRRASASSAAVYFKLNDPLDPMNSGSHQMDKLELQSELGHYDNIPLSEDMRVTPVLPMHLPTGLPLSVPPHCTGGLPFWGMAQIAGYEAYFGSQAYKSTELFPFYPNDHHGGPVASTSKIRAGDTVHVILCGRQQHDPVRSPIWHSHCKLLVISVTSFGLVTALATEQSEACPFVGPKMGFLSFPSTAVVGVKHGANWATYSHGTSH